MNPQMPPSDFDQIDAKAEVRETNAESEAKAVLEAELTSLRGRIKVERLCALICIMIIFDVPVFSDFNNWGGPLAVLVLELMVIFLIGKSFEVDHIPELFDNIVSAATSKMHKK